MLKTKNDYHLLRKLGHLFPGLSLVLIIESNILSLETLNLYLARLLIFVLVVEFLRFQVPFINDLFLKLFKKFLRDNESKEYSGILSYVLGILLVLFFLPQAAAIVAILCLSVGDPVASFFGLYFSKKNKNFKLINKKTIMGFLFMFLSSFLVSLIYLLNSFTFYESFTIAALSSLTAATMETFLGDLVNDNLIIPISSGLVASSLIYFL